MKKQLFIIALVGAAFFTSCTSAYKSGQTPDDVYYSPERPEDEYWSAEDSRRTTKSKYEYAEDYYDDRFLRMRVRNRKMWSQLDDWYYFGNSRYSHVYYNGFWDNPWTPNHYWNTWYNPYYGGSGYYTGGHYTPIVVKNNTLKGPRTVNLNTYDDRYLSSSHYTNQNTGKYKPVNMGSNKGSNKSNTGSILRDIFSGNNNNNNSADRKPSFERSSSNNNSSNNNSSSNNSSSGGTAPVRKF